MKEMTTIWISNKNKKRLDGVGSFKESYDDVLGKVLDLFEENKANRLIKEKTE